MNEDPLNFLKNCTKEDIMTFLKWMHDNYRIKKVSSSQEYKRIFFMLYRRCVGRSLHAKIASDIDDVSVIPLCCEEIRSTDLLDSISMWT